ncbi:LysR substrate-binding domain-containing protein [Salinicola peritrichatus]|uniref:LysR substrate-binding domain-containing protein n=1 Tax=Salinicola peritrichatus TaxID=1267424 RepID=UPI000DA23224|nr:LysR substrate-binding domain-containing protein [Salinicola peritrichatus]
MTDSAVSHQLRKLEDHLRAPLVERQGRGIRLTGAGRRYADQLAAPLTEIAGLTERLFGASRGTGVTLTVGPVVASLGLIPFVAGLESDHPDLVLQLITTTRLLDLDAMGIDLALRYERKPVTEGDPLSFPEYAFPVCTPELARHGAEQTLKQRRLLNAAHADDWQRWVVATGRELAPAPREMRLDTSEMVMNAALRGMGVTIGRTPLVNDALLNGQLVAPFGTATPGEGSYRIVTSSRHPDDKVQAVIRWLGNLLGRP